MVIFGVLVGGWLALAPVAAEEAVLQVSAKSYVIMDAKSGQILLSCNPQLFCPPASTLKVMTAMSVVEHLKLDDKVPVSAYAAAAPASKIQIKAGRPIRCRTCSMPCCFPPPTTRPALAERESGCEEAFASQLTREVRQVGAYRTTLATANSACRQTTSSPRPRTWPCSV